MLVWEEETIGGFCSSYSLLWQMQTNLKTVYSHPMSSLHSTETIISIHVLQIFSLWNQASFLCSWGWFLCDIFPKQCQISDNHSSHSWSITFSSLKQILCRKNRTYARALIFLPPLFNCSHFEHLFFSSYAFFCYDYVLDSCYQEAVAALKKKISDSKEFLPFYLFSFTSSHGIKKRMFGLRKKHVCFLILCSCFGWLLFDCLFNELPISGLFLRDTFSK